jgi:long-chain acyl-CoA synthetase
MMQIQGEQQPSQPQEKAAAESETLVTLFAATVERVPDRPALRSKRGGTWQSMTWSELGRKARVVAAELVARGIDPGDRVAIFGNTREEWVIADIAVTLAGAITVPVYQTLIGDQVAYILADSGAKVLFAEDGSFVTRLLETGALDAIGAIVVFDDARLSGLPANVRAKTLTWRTLVTRGETREPAELERLRAREASVKPGDLATIVYTSGTTGPPKGVMLTHGNFAFETSSLAQAVDLRSEDEQLLFLPMAHIFAKILVALQIRVGSSTAFAESLIKALENAVEVNPTYMACVPRLYEKIYAVANEKAAQQGTIKNKVFHWATSVGRQVAKLTERGGNVDGLLDAQHHYADKLVLKQIRERFGKRLRLAISGGAPLAKELAEWFHGAGVRVLEGYGLTETTAATNINRLNRYRFGSVGPALPGVEVKIAPDGEVVMRGPNIMKGYWHKDADTREAIDADGWFHSGDIGVIDVEGFLTITDRKKDIIVTAGGKNVAPQNIENLLKQSPYISQAMVYGDRRPYLVALVTLDADAMTRFARETGRDADLAKLAEDSEVRARLQLEIDAVNRKLSQFETIKKFAILAQDFTIEGGDLTPTLKVKRKVVTERHRAKIDAMYEGDASRE